jgi:glycosyltransferase involved in cell wall biosynthesis
MSSHTVSVVIPTYNRVHLLERALSSVLSQTAPVHEVIIVDDGSTDGTAEYVARLSEQDCRVILLRQVRGGASSARNRGIAHASGSLVAFQDSDDEWHPEFLETLLRYHAAPGVVAFSSMMTVDPSGTAKAAFPNEIKDVKAQLVKSNCISTQTCVIDRELLKFAQFDVRLPRLQDWDLWLSIIDQATFIHVPRALVTQHLQSDSITLESEYRLYVALRLITEKHWRVLARRPLSLARFWLVARLHTVTKK